MEGECEIPVTHPMNDGAMETVKYMRVDISSILDWIELCYKTEEMHFPSMSCSTSGYIKVRWQFGKGVAWGEVVRWHSDTDTKAVKWQDGRYPILFKDREKQGETKISSL